MTFTTNVCQMEPVLQVSLLACTVRLLARLFLGLDIAFEVSTVAGFFCVCICVYLQGQLLVIQQEEVCRFCIKKKKGFGSFQGHSEFSLEPY